jgi:hypothetical protein
MTTLRNAVDALLGEGESLESFVRDRRGQDMSWRRIAYELYERTGVDLTHESLRKWFPDEQRDQQVPA